MSNAFICDAIRTPIGRYGGALAHVRTDDLGALPLRALIERNARVDWAAVEDVIYGCANQAGEDNRNVGRMALLRALADGGTTVLMVEQNVRTALKYSNRALVLEMGRLALDRPANELLKDPDLNRLFLGGHAERKSA